MSRSDQCSVRGWRVSGPVAFLCGVVLLTAACGTDSDRTLTNLLLGVNLDLSGPGKEAGQAQKNALNLMVEKLNSERAVPGRKIVLVVRDNKGNADLARQAARKLVETHKVVGIIGAGNSTTSLGMVDYVEAARIPTISLGSADAIVNPLSRRQYVFKTPVNPQSIVDLMVRTFDRAAVTRVGLLAVDDLDGRAGRAAVEQAATAAGSRMTLLRAETFPANQTENGLDASVLRVLNREPEAIVVWSGVSGAIVVAKALRNARYDGRVYLVPEAGAEIFAQQAGPAAEGVFMVHPSILVINQLVATTPSAVAQKEFYVEYSQRYGSFSSFASYAADALALFVTAIEKVDSTDPEKVRDGLESGYDGLTGTYNFSVTNHGGADDDALAVLTLHNGNWVPAT